MDGHPLIFYHFQGLKSLTSRIFYDGLIEYGGMNCAARNFLYLNYVRELDSTRRRLRTTKLINAGTIRANERPSGPCSDLRGDVG